MIKHVVMWKLKEEHDGMNRDEIARKIKADLEKLADTIPELAMIEVGINAREAPAACDVCLYSAFETWEDLGTYQQHPDHRDVVAFVKEVVVDRHVVDYEISA